MSCGPSLRSASPLRSEDVLVGIADGFHRSLRSPVRRSLALPPAMPSAALERGSPTTAPLQLSTDVDSSKGCSSGGSPGAARLAQARSDDPCDGSPRDPSGSRSRHRDLPGRQPAKLARGWVEHRDHTDPPGSALDGRHPHPSSRRGATRTQSQPEISPYDTGARREPKLWQPNSEAVAEVMRSGEAGGIGNVDFTNGENGTVVTVHVSRSDDRMYTVHLMPMCDDDQIRRRAPPGEGPGRHRTRYQPAGMSQRHAGRRLSRHRGHSSRLQLWRPPSHQERRLE